MMGFRASQHGFVRTRFWNVGIISKPVLAVCYIDIRIVVFKLGWTKTQGFGEAVAGVWPRSP